ncbi:MAG: type VI secretion system Vgr family protein, partial [Pseudomonas sp.]
MEALAMLQATVAQLMDGSRLHRLSLGGFDEQVVERWQGREALSQGFDYWVDVLSTDAALPVEAWLAQPAHLHTRSAEGGEVVRSGLVNEAELLGSDGGLARYRVRLVGWSWWLSQGRHSRVFQDRSVVEIVEAVFAGYAPQASWRWSEEAVSFLAQARPRGYCVQYRESDMAFVARLLAEEGIGWRMEACEQAPAGHRMVLFADSGAQAQDATGRVRYHRADATEASDSLQVLGRRRRLGASQLTVLSSSYARMRASSAQLPLSGGGTASQREIYDPVGEYAFSSAAEAERYAGLMAQAQEAQWSIWEGEGSVRSFQSGTWFEVAQWPHGAAPTLLLTGLTHAAVNNLPADARQAAQDLLGEAEPPLAIAASTWARAEAVGYANRFTAVARSTPWRPVLADETGARLNPRPTAPGYQSARVVGAEASLTASGSQEVYADAQGRVRVQFHFQGGAGEATRQDSTWLRVAQRYAGPGVGSQFLPRIGQEVLVGFLEGDIDRPVVLGALYNGRGEAGTPATPGGQPASADTALYAQAGDARPSAQANLAGGHAPAWHAAGGGEEGHRHAGALWGVQSKEWGGSGHSRLVFDDSDQQLRVQLATTQA